MDDAIIATTTVDATGLACPMPLVRTRQGMDAIASGEVLRVMSTDRGSLSDLPAWADAMGHEILRVDESEGGRQAAGGWGSKGDVIVFYIRKA
jgi:TusA-related sulfurtransferase